MRRMLSLALCMVSLGCASAPPKSIPPAAVVSPTPASSPTPPASPSALPSPQKPWISNIKATTKEEQFAEVVLTFFPSTDDGVRSTMRDFAKSLYPRRQEVLSGLQSNEFSQSLILNGQIRKALQDAGHPLSEDTVSLMRESVYTGIRYWSAGGSDAIPVAGDYLGKAATGEDVYYISDRIYCPQSPKGDPCWNSPSVVYQIGVDRVEAIADCTGKTLTTTLVGGKESVIKITPQSGAIADVIKRACDR